METWSKADEAQFKRLIEKKKRIDEYNKQLDDVVFTLRTLANLIEKHPYGCFSYNRSIEYDSEDHSYVTHTIKVPGCI